MKFKVLSLILSLVFLWGCSAAAVSTKTEAEKKPDPAAQNFSRGLIAMNHGRYENAEKYFLETLKLTPDSYNTRMHLGKVYEELHRSLNAIGQYREAIRINGKDSRAYNSLMAMYIRMGLAYDALTVGDMAIQNGVPEEAVLINIGWCYYMVGALDEAESRFKAAKALIKDDTQPMNDLGLVYFTQGRYKEALENFLEAGRLNPKSAFVPYFTALTYNKLGERDKVIESLKEGLDKNPNLESKAAAYNSQFFLHSDPGDLSGYFNELKGGK